ACAAAGAVAFEALGAGAAPGVACEQAAISTTSSAPTSRDEPRAGMERLLSAAPAARGRVANRPRCSQKNGPIIRANPAVGAPSNAEREIRPTNRLGAGAVSLTRPRRDATVGATYRFGQPA